MSAEERAEAGTPEIAPRRYRSIFLSDDWAHQRYFGWDVASDRPGLRVLQKRRGPVCRSLVLLTRGGEAFLQGELASLLRRLQLNDIYVHDFDGTFSAEEQPAHLRFHELPPGQRILNVTTYVADLLEAPEVLESNLGANSRNKIRRAEAAGARFVIADGDARLLDAFFEHYLPLARERKLSVPDRSSLARMAKDGRLLLTACVSAAGDVDAVSAVYRSGRTAYHMHGVRAPSGVGGAGQFLHWRTMLLARELGCEWYDFGGVADPQVMDGIHAFKKSMGGVLVHLGREYRCSKLVITAAEHLMKIVRRA